MQLICCHLARFTYRTGSAHVCIPLSGTPQPSSQESPRACNRIPTNSQASHIDHDSFIHMLSVPGRRCHKSFNVCAYRANPRIPISQVSVPGSRIPLAAGSTPSLKKACPCLPVSLAAYAHPLCLPAFIRPSPRQVHDCVAVRAARLRWSAVTIRTCMSYSATATLRRRPARPLGGGGLLDLRCGSTRPATTAWLPARAWSTGAARSSTLAASPGAHAARPRERLQQARVRQWTR